MVTARTRLPRAAHTARPWHVHQIAPDFDVLDVWALPTPGGVDDFPRLVTVLRSLDAERSSAVVQALFAVRWALGRVLTWDDSPRGATAELFTPLYVTEDEAASEIVNRTVHGVLHLGWVPDGSGGYRGQMAVLVKPNGLVGRAYLAAIAPFRHLIVYPAMLRAIGRAWRAEVPAVVTVGRIDPPRDARALSTLPDIDYADAFVVAMATAPDWTAERWARTVLEGAPAQTRAKLSAGWSALGLVSTTADRAILGWEIRHASPDAVLLGRDSRIGMPGELLFLRRPEGMLFATFVQHRTVVTRALWSVVERGHLQAVSMLLTRAGRTAADDVRASAGAG